jgi:hypothetical protein
MEISIDMVDGKPTLYLKQTLDTTGRLSSTGKSTIHGGTGGFTRVGDYKVAVNVIKDAQK